MSHKGISFIKSGVRILGYICGAVAFSDMFLGSLTFGLLISSEIIGIIEEIGQ